MSVSTSDVDTSGFINVGEALTDRWPSFLPQLPETTLLDHLWADTLQVYLDTNSVRASARLLLENEIVLTIPGVDAVGITIAASLGDTLLPVEVAIYPDFSVTLLKLPIALRLKTDLFRPAKRQAGASASDPPQWVVNTTEDHVDIQLAEVTISVNGDGDITVDFEGAIDLPPCMIGNSGAVIEAHDIGLYLSAGNPAPGQPAGWRGIHMGTASLYLPGELSGSVGTLTLTDAYIGNGGFSGSVSAAWTPPLPGSLFGIGVTLAHAEITFVQNTPETFELSGTAALPFFDQPVGVDLQVGIDGSIGMKASAVQPPGATTSNGLLQFTKPDLLTMQLDSLAFAFENDVFTAQLSGTLKPLVGGLDWPGFHVQQLAIDSHGNVRLEGGWLNLPNQYSLDFHGFQLEITKLGFGKSDDGGKWIGFSGALKLVDGLSAGASVEGLRLTWYEDGRPVDITLNDVGVELAIPDVLHFKGAVSYRELPGDVSRFDGSIKLNLLALNLEVDGMLVIGTAPGYNFFAIYLDAELPAGFPLWSSGLALYGMAGLFALNMKPDKAPADSWYEIGGTTDWYHRAPVGVTDLQHKWTNEQEALALGAGVTIGTIADNGYTFSGRVLLVISFPGPVLLLQGAANLLKERSKLDQEPIFRALAVLDSRAGTFLVGLDAQYKNGSGAELIDIHGGVEAFYNLNDADAWHLYLGLKDPKEKRIRAEIFKLFQADSYLMLDSHQLALGAWVGYSKHWSFGPLSVTVEAWIEGNAVLSRKPVHLHGDLWLHGKAELKVFGFGAGLSVDARFSSDIFHPYHILGEFKVGINLPWPLPDFDEDITLEWGPEVSHPPLPLPLKEIAIEHFKVTTSWPLPRGGAQPLLLPNFDSDADGFLQAPDPSVAVQELAPPPNGAPVVPLDARPHLTFGRSVHDAALIGVNAQAVVPEWERIGDPANNEGPVQVKYSLAEVALHKYEPGGTWQLVARKATTSNPPGVPDLFGSWAPVPAMPDGGGANTGQVKLWLWSKTPFDYTRHTSSSWDEWFTDRFGGYPCVTIPPDREICCDFEGIDPAQQFPSPLSCPDNPKFRIVWLAPTVQSVTVLPTSASGQSHALCFPGTVGGNDTVPGVFRQVFQNIVTIIPPEPAKQVRIVLAPAATEALAFGFDANNQSFGPFFPQNGFIDVVGDDMVQVQVRGALGFCIVKVCATIAPGPAEVTRYNDLLQHLRDELARWSQTGAVLEPDTQYRLKVVTNVETTDAPIGDFEETEFAYFGTEGPPGLTALSVPIGSPNPDQFQSGLDDLIRYVGQTVPATVPAPGEQPSLPRPVYRGYDVGVEFNEDYVDLMYRLAGRDLGLYLYNSNNQPVRDAQGRLIVLENRWGRTEDLTLTESDKLWVTVINGSDCAAVDTTLIPHAATLSGTRGEVLDPDIVYEGRLVPLLLHETFAGYTLGAIAAGPSGQLGRWLVLDEGANEGPSQWQVGADGVPPSRFITQSTNIWGGTVDGTDPVKPGTLLLYGDNPMLPSTDPDQPGNWSDYRFSVYARSADDDAIGVVFRYLDASDYYHFSMNRARPYRRLVRVVGGITTVLAEDDFTYLQNRDYRITVEAIGSSLRVHQDGAPVCSVTDSSIDHGRIGLYCWADEGARFSDVRVDDYRAAAPVVYRFKFTTSQFVNFFHHLHSYQDEVWPLTLPDSADIAPDVAQAVALGVPPTPPADAEQRAFDSLAGTILGQDATRIPQEVQVTQVERSGDILALLVQSAEPIDWKRTLLDVSLVSRWAPAPKRPLAVKLTDVTFGNAQPNDESVTLLLRDPTDLTGYSIEYRHFPEPLAERAGDPVLFTDSFGDRESGLLFQEKFGTNALDHYYIVDEGNQLRPSSWSVVGSQIVQTSNIYGGSISGSEPDKPGTLALTGSTAWDDVRIRAGFRSTTDGAVGIVFRYQDSDNYYRFSMDRQRSYRRLVKRVCGKVKVLWEDATAYDVGHLYGLQIVAAGTQLLGYLDDVLLFSLADTDLQAGRVGLYCWANHGAHFWALTVESVEPPIVLWQPESDSLSDVEIVDEPGTVEGPSRWAVTAGTFTQSSTIHAVDVIPLSQPGTYVLGGSPNWRDVQISVGLRSDTGQAIGVIFRYQDANNYYRFSMDSTAGYRRLVKKVGGAVSVVWEDSVAYALAQSHEVTLRASGGHITVSMDGATLFAVDDDDLNRGQVGLYCAANPDARFERILVAEGRRRVGQWLLHDEGTWSFGPSVWRSSGDSLMQLGIIQGGAAPAYPGTMATAGDLNWTDYRFTVLLRSDTDQALGVVLRYQDDDNYYRFSMALSPGYRRLIKKVAGVVTTLWEDVGGYVIGQDTTVTIDAVGGRLTGYQDSARLFCVDDADLAAGQVGLYAWGNPGARFERVEVLRSPLEAYALLRDRFTADDTTGWSFIDEGTTSAPSNWATFQGALRQTSSIFSPPNDRDSLSKLGTQTIPGDPTIAPSWSDVVIGVRLQSFGAGAIGLMFRYQDATHYYRFSMDRQLGYRRLVKNVGGTFTLLWQDAIAYDVGRAYQLTVTAVGSILRGFLDGVPLFVVRDGDLGSGNIGLYCWANTDARFSDVGVYPAAQRTQTWLLDDPFAVLASGRWRSVDEGDLGGPSQWAVTAGELWQTSKIQGGDPDPAVPDKPGTYMTTGEAIWTDYRLSVRLLSDTDQGIGVLFRYQDNDNYYRFSIDRSRGFRRLIKKAAGAITTLWEDAVPYTVGREYVLTVDCLGNRLTGYLDGIEVFGLDDASLAAGGIGLYCWANPGARFREVRVAVPIWTPYYRFGAEDLLPAGTRVRVFAGNAAAAPPAEARVLQRFAAPLDASGHVRLSPAGGADLRLAPPGGGEEHTRRFLAEGDYSPVAAGLLRKADGTGFFLLVPDGSPPGTRLTAGQYRLKLSYIRDNRAADPTSQLYSQAGDSGPENVTIDIPVGPIDLT